jgi:hypothetical protein
MLVLALYQDQTFTGSCAKASAAIALLIAFGLAVVPLTYCYAFAFSNHANAQVLTASVHLLLDLERLEVPFSWLPLIPRR